MKCENFTNCYHSQSAIYGILNKIASVKIRCWTEKKSYKYLIRKKMKTAILFTLYLLSIKCNDGQKAEDGKKGAY